MQFSLGIAALLATAAVSSASPVSARDATTPPAKYNLRTKVVDGKAGSGSNKDGLYLVSYHTGAGLGAAGLAQTPPEQWYAYLENGHQYFTYPGSNAPWPLNVNEYAPYQSWTDLTISVSSSPNQNEVFSFNSSGLQVNQQNNGWIVCDWWYAYPELFLLQGGYPADSYPSSCSKVELHPVAIE